MMPSYEMGPIRPPSEGGALSLLIRLTRNCPWGRCRFCGGSLFRRNKFEIRKPDEIKRDIDSIRQIADIFRSLSWQLGRGGVVDDVVGTVLAHNRPDLQKDPSFVSVFYWLYAGGRSAFLQDADSLIMKSPDLVDAVSYLKATLPSLERITSYARAKSLYRKTPEELKQLRAAGLQRLHVGLETGDDDLLKVIDKGITAEQHIAAGKKVKEAGFQLSLYIMPDLGGRAMSEQHAKNTALVLNAINPDYIRSRPFVPRPPTPMYADYQAGTIQLSSPYQRLKEIRMLVEGLDVTSRLCFDHFGNSWNDSSGQPLFSRSYEGYKLPEEKQAVLDLNDQGLTLDESVHVDVKELMNVGHM